MGFVFKTNNLKKSLQSKTSKRRKHLEGATSVKATAWSTDLDLVPKMAFQRRQIKSLKSAKRRVRKTPAEQLQNVMRSLQRFKQVAPILIDEQGHIVHGHAVVEAMLELGQKEVVCAVVDHLDEHERELLHVALNRIAETGEWAIEELGNLLLDLDKQGLKIDVTGFSLPELDILLQPELGVDDTDHQDDVTETHPPALPVSLVGDLWVLGKHRLLCGDATDSKSYERVLAGKQADVVFTDCPWNIPIEGSVRRMWQG